MKKIILSISIIILAGIIFFLASYKNDYGIKSRSNPILKEQTDSFYIKDGYEFTSIIKAYSETPEGLEISIQHMRSDLLSNKEFISQIEFKTNQNFKDDVIIKNAKLQHSSENNKIIPLIFDNKGIYLNSSSFPLKLSKNDSKFLVQKYEISKLPKEIEEDIYIELLVNGQNKTIESTLDLKWVKRFLRLDLFLQI